MREGKLTSREKRAYIVLLNRYTRIVKALNENRAIEASVFITMKKKGGLWAIEWECPLDCGSLCGKCPTYIISGKSCEHLKTCQLMSFFILGPRISYHRKSTRLKYIPLRIKQIGQWLKEYS